MEIFYFTLGITFVFVMALAIATIWVMFRVSRIKSSLNLFEKQIETSHNDITMVERTIENGIANRFRNVDDGLRDMYRDIEECRRYIDSRIDKLTTKLEGNK